MKPSVAQYKLIAIVSFFVLVSVQFFLSYNTYKLENEHFFSKEKNVLNREYSASIRNDYVFPGGRKIIDKYVSVNLSRLEQMYNNNLDSFTLCRQVVCDSIFKELRAHCNLDSLIKIFIKKNNLTPKVHWACTIEWLAVQLPHNKTMNLYQTFDNSSNGSRGVILGGELHNLNPQNLTASLTVTSIAEYTVQIKFCLYADLMYRQIAILRMMMPTFLLSFLSLIAVAFIFYITFGNWLKQKKLADMKSDFVNSITHEFHTPLATINVANKSLQNERIIENKEMISSLTAVIARQTQRLTTLVSRVLDITKMSSSTLKKEEGIIEDLLDEILLDYRLKHTNGNVEIEFVKQCENHKVLLDKFLFTTMLYNILDNAEKYNTNGTKKIWVYTASSDGLLKLSIRDNGIGMSPSVIQHIFEKFYRDAQSKNKAGGLGLGLFYVKQCLLAHGWEIEVKSESRKGSEFIISIPVIK